MFSLINNFFNHFTKFTYYYYLRRCILLHNKLHFRLSNQSLTALQPILTSLLFQQTIDEFDMLRDGDKVLVCISGSSPSLCMLHMLRQFCRARGLHVDFGAVTVGECVGIDPRALMLYLRDLGVEFIFEASNTTSLKNKLSSTARRKGYNVLAMGQTLDKLADDFLSSVLYKGRLYLSPPCAKNRFVL